MKYVWEGFFVLGVNYQAWGDVKSHSNAQTLCQTRGGTNLASFVSQDNINRIEESIAQIQGSGSWDFWTGLKYTKSSDTWSFIDGTDTTFALSQVNLPEMQNVHTDQCMMIRGNGDLSITHCSESRRVVCQNGHHPTG